MLVLQLVFSLTAQLILKYGTVGSPRTVGSPCIWEQSLTDLTIPQCCRSAGSRQASALSRESTASPNDTTGPVQASQVCMHACTLPQPYTCFVILQLITYPVVVIVSQGTLSQAKKIYASVYFQLPCIHTANCANIPLRACPAELWVSVQGHQKERKIYL